MTVATYYEEQKEQAKKLGFKRIVPINIDTYPEEAVDALWERVWDADYAFEDTTRGDKTAFARTMIQPGTYNFEIPGEAFGQLMNCTPGSNAFIHFIVLSKGPTTPLIDAASEMFDFAFTKVGCHRVTATIPGFNQKVIRMASLIRMKFEGQMRKAFLYNGSWWDLHIYGLLDHEWKGRV